MSIARIQAKAAKNAHATLREASAELRSAAIAACADQIEADVHSILDANTHDMERAKDANMKLPLQDRLLLTEERIASIASSLREISAQHDPLGEVLSGSTLSSGVRIEKVRVPMGVVGIIYEARPNVTADAAALCLRSGNACVLRGGSAAHDSCMAIVASIRKALSSAGLPEDCVCYIDSTDRAETLELMQAKGLIDILIPRGGSELINFCIDNSKVPCIETGVGNCHLYVHKSAEIEMARDILINAKCQRPGVCNACESLLIDEDIADEALPILASALAREGVELRCDERSYAICEQAGIEASLATDTDWATEFLDLCISIRVVNDTNEALAHIERYGTKHSEAIITSDYEVAERFLASVDAAAVYVNASTRFTDGGVFGLGGEIGISTQKLHERGPMGASALTTTKYLVRGDGQIR